MQPSDRRPEESPPVDPTEPTPDGTAGFLDAASPAEGPALASWQEDRRLAADPDADVDARLESFENIFESEIGDTSLSRARNIEREVGIRQLYVKFEGGNSTGTQKDRIAFAQVMDALRRGYDAITAASCGNYGVAIALAASCAGIRCLVFVPQGYRTRRVAEIETLGAEVVRVPGDYENAVVASKERATRDEVYDANAGGANTILQLRAYGEIAYEIYDELRDAPAAVAVPVSNGTTLAGIHHGFVSLYRRGKTSRIPRMIAGSTFRKNPIVHSFVTGSAKCLDLNPDRVHESPINEPLVNWHSSDGQTALDAVRGSNGWASYASDRAMRQCARDLREREGLSGLPASMAGLIALTDPTHRDSLSGDRYVAVVTGRG
ncbi:MAG: threonine synthase [Gemmatimonadota bacterium]|nr:MAG: threonine synthase [Gemmatimonadota bacterium]